MVTYIAAYVATLVVFLGIDSIWLGLMASRLYKPTLGDILLPKFLPVPAVAFYLLFVVGILIFAEVPAMKSGQWTTALLYGALFGFFSYGVYDFTNWATLRNWSWQITFADVIWGTVLTGTAASLGYIVSSAVARALHIGG